MPRGSGCLLLRRFVTGFGHRTVGGGGGLVLPPGRVDQHVANEIATDAVQPPGSRTHPDCLLPPVTNGQRVRKRRQNGGSALKGSDNGTGTWSTVRQNKCSTMGRHKCWGNSTCVRPTGAARRGSSSAYRAAPQSPAARAPAAGVFFYNVERFWSRGESGTVGDVRHGESPQ